MNRTGTGTDRLTYFSASWDAYLAARQGEDGIARRQQQRLRHIVAYARAHSSYYRRLYRDVPESLSDISQLPAVTKAELMSHFDDWVTDPAVTRAQVQEFLADPHNVGRDFQDRYVVCTTSGATGIPAILLHDHSALVVYNVLGYIRSLPVAFLSCSHCERRAGTGVFASRRSGTSHSAATDTGGSRWTR